MFSFGGIIATFLYRLCLTVHSIIILTQSFHSNRYSFAIKSKPKEVNESLLPFPYWEKLRDEQGCVCVEMESFALFANAQVLGKHAACLLTISDSFVSPEATTAEQRQKSFTDMMKVALGADY